jgi:hypothetical protein
MAVLRRRNRSAPRRRRRNEAKKPNNREDTIRIATRLACMTAAVWLGLAVAGAAEIVLVTANAVKAILNGLVPA